jgi:hypothetical protein
VIPFPVGGFLLQSGSNTTRVTRHHYHHFSTSTYSYTPYFTSLDPNHPEQFLTKHFEDRISYENLVFLKMRLGDFFPNIEISLKSGHTDVGFVCKLERDAVVRATQKRGA